MVLGARTAVNGETLGPAAVRAVYDRVGRYQDSQRFYEDPAVDRLIAQAEMGSARAVFELGCGTGRLARRLLRDHLGGDARYHGVDVSPVMVELAMDRLRPWAARAETVLVDGTGPLPVEAATHDRVVATYVFDLLSPAGTAAALDELRRIVADDGLLCLASLTPGATPAARLVDRAWMALWHRAPGALGGCRHVSMIPPLAERGWRVEHRETLTAWARTSEVVVARPG